MHVLDLIGRSFADAGGMFWQTLWALVLGFGLSGAVQAFVSRAEMQRALGDHRPATIARAGFFGAISSSCSYAASALAKTLFARGADFAAAQAFMFASTNLVVELGIVLWLLIGWQFAAAEFVGGALMIALLGLVLPRVVPAAQQEAARRRLTGGTAGPGEHAGHGDLPAHPSGSWRTRVRSLAGWSDAAGYTISDLTMLRKELLIGFVVAGFADAAVPVSFWQSLFITGHGFWSALENAVLGPFLAVISFVCSIGNVPLAAALWTGGITFGGTIAFVFGDLITLPLLLIYRRYYGTRITAKLLGVFWATMSAAGLATEYLFRWAGIAPAPGTAVPGTAGHGVWGWNYTTFLNIAAIAVFAGLYWLHRNRERFGGGTGFARDPVCGMQVQVAHAPATARHQGTAYHFCSDHCQQRFAADPARYAAAPAPAGVAGVAGDAGHSPGGPHQHEAAAPGDGNAVTDPVCGMTVSLSAAAARASYAGQDYYFCGTGCAEHFAMDPPAVLADAPAGRIRH